MSGALELHSFLDMEPSIRMLERSQAEAVVFLGKVGVGLSAERLLAGALRRMTARFSCSMMRRL